MFKTRRRLAATLLGLLAIYGYFVYTTVRVATASSLGTAEVTLIAVLSSALLALLVAAGAFALREARDRVAAVVARELAKRDTGVTAIADTLWPTAADVSDYVAAPTEIRERLAVPERPGRHRSDALADTQEYPVTELLDDTEPKLFTHEQLFGHGRREA